MSNFILQTFHEAVKRNTLLGTVVTKPWEVP